MNRTIIPTPPHKRSRRVIYAGRLSTSQDGIVVSPHGIAPCHTAGHGNCPNDASPALYLKPESVTAFLQKNEDGQQQYIYATVSHRPTSTQIDAIIAEQMTI